VRRGGRRDIAEVEPLDPASGPDAVRVPEAVLVVGDREP